MVLLNTTQLGAQVLYPNIATDLSGQIMWYYMGSTDE